MEVDEEVATIETDKVDVSVNATHAGKIVELLAKEEDTVEVGAALFRIEEGAEGECESCCFRFLSNSTLYRIQLTPNSQSSFYKHPPRKRKRPRRRRKSLRMRRRRKRKSSPLHPLHRTRNLPHHHRLRKTSPPLPLTRNLRRHHQRTPSLLPRRTTNRHLLNLPQVLLRFLVLAMRLASR